MTIKSNGLNVYVHTRQYACLYELACTCFELYLSSVLQVLCESNLPSGGRLKETLIRIKPRGM